MAKIGPKGRRMKCPHILFARRFYITYQKMKEIGPIPRKLWLFPNFFGLDTLLTDLDLGTNFVPTKTNV